MMFDLALLFYVLSLVHVALYIFLGYDALKTPTLIISGAAVLLNAATVAARWIDYGTFPSASLHDLMVLLSLTSGLLFGLLYFRFRKLSYSLFTIPAAVIFGLLALFTADLSVMRPAVTSVWLYLHLPFTIIGTVFFIVSFVAGMLYFVQERQLKAKKFGVMFRSFPPLESINRLNTVSLMAGVYTFTIGTVSGFLWLLYEKHGNILLTPKLLFSIITWVTFTTILVIKKRWGMTPRGTALSSVVGCISLLVTYIGVALFLIR